MVKAVGARELKTRLGAYLRQVREGNTIVVTDRGVPVAELRPVSEPAANELDRLEQLAALGLVTRRSRADLETFRRIRVTGRSLAETVIEDREDRL